jgi:hypothetical protein
MALSPEPKMTLEQAQEPKKPVSKPAVEHRKNLESKKQGDIFGDEKGKIGFRHLLKKELKQEEEKRVCKDCGKTFSTIFNLQRHQTHDHGKPIKKRKVEDDKGKGGVKLKKEATKKCPMMTLLIPSYMTISIYHKDNNDFDYDDNSCPPSPN